MDDLKLVGKFSMMDLWHNEKYWDYQREISRMEEILEHAKESGKYPGILPRMEQSLIRHNILFITDVFCEDCKHRDEPLEWHDNVIVESETDIKDHTLVIRCSHYEPK